MAQTTEHTYEDIKKTLFKFWAAARYSVAKNLRRMTPAQRYSTARALVFMATVAAHPELYFSRDATADAWMTRDSRVRDYDLRNAPFRSDLFGTSPAEFVAARAWMAFENNLQLCFEYKRFCEKVTDWEYDRTSMNARRKCQAYIHIDKIAPIMEQSKTWRMRYPEKMRKYMETDKER